MKIMKFLTLCLMLPDGTAIENNGAVPDYPYTITIEDYVNEYKNYQNAYIKKLLELLP
ncbi:MAG: hypothetical protein HY072_08705 [Deltaproteobacteria bacterium]|nr:hypothetical protein [Deltaproteobacteria bacterium]